MKTPRVKDFDPNAKIPSLKSSLDNMPVIKKPLNGLTTVNDTEGSTKSPSKTITSVESRSKNIQGVPPSVPRTVPRTVPLVPKQRRAIKQRQPFDIFQDQYDRLKKIAASEREFVNGKGMSQIVREALDIYLQEHYPISE